MEPADHHSPETLEWPEFEDTADWQWGPFPTSSLEPDTPPGHGRAGGGPVQGEWTVLMTLGPKLSWLQQYLKKIYLCHENMINYHNYILYTFISLNQNVWLQCKTSMCVYVQYKALGIILLGNEKIQFKTFIAFFPILLIVGCNMFLSNYNYLIYFFLYHLVRLTRFNLEFTNMLGDITHSLASLFRNDIIYEETSAALSVTSAYIDHAWKSIYIIKDMEAILPTMNYFIMTCFIFLSCLN